MRFSELIRAVPAARVLPGRDPEIRALVYDSRDVTPGACFVCRRGLRVDAHDHVSAAVQAGAVAVVAERRLDVAAGVAFATAPDGRRALAALALAFWESPDRELGLIGVTGTDGKTTTAQLIAWMLRAHGLETGELTTVHFAIGDSTIEKGTRLTTPEAPALAALLRQMSDAGVRWAAMEVASHALELARVDGFAFDRGVVTNVTHEHLDLHGSIDGYRAAKRRLLELLDDSEPKPYGKVAVLNADDPVVAGFRAELRSDVITFGIDARADVRVSHATGDDGTLQIEGDSPWGGWSADTRLVGPWNASNIAAAVACVGSITGAVEAGVAALASFPPVVGRMEPLEAGQPFRAFVDFAHTPHALESVLRELRRTTPGRLIVVFGAAGEQDRAKRPMLGRVAARLADIALVTDEDPRSERPADIADEILAGADGVDSAAAFEVVLDRREAIRRAFTVARAGDSVLLAGKGHESSIAYADREMPWSEREAAFQELAAAGYDDA